MAPAEQQLFRLCSVFSGGFTLELIMQVAEPAEVVDSSAESRWAVVDNLGRLVDGSLVSTDLGEPPRFTLLETMREYAARRLAESSDERVQRSHHARALAELARRALVDLGNASLISLALAEHDNLREAIAWLISHEPARGVEMAIHTARVAAFSSWRLEALRWLESFEEVVERACRRHFAPAGCKRERGNC